MTAQIRQEDLFRTPDLRQAVRRAVSDILASNDRPSAAELIVKVEQKAGVHARLDLLEVVQELARDVAQPQEARAYLASLLEPEALPAALRGSVETRKEVESSVDELLRQSGIYRSSKDFRSMIEFMAKFREYAPYNNMLVRVQNPRCGFYATPRDWRERFGRWIKEDARPMLILAPMHPVMLVYDLDATEGRELPKQLEEFGRFAGPWDSKWLDNLLENIRRHRIRVAFKTLSSTNAGFAQWQPPDGEWKARIVIHDGLDEPSRFGILCHELAHVLLGHLGGDPDRWWPARAGVGRKTAEIEAEAVAYIVTTRFGLTGGSASYVSGYVRDGALPKQVSVDTIGKVSSKIEQMAQRKMPAPKPRPAKSGAPTGANA